MTTEADRKQALQTLLTERDQLLIECEVLKMRVAAITQERDALKKQLEERGNP